MLSLVWKKSLSATIQMLLFITLYMQGGSGILVFDESYCAVLSFIVLFSY